MSTCSRETALFYPHRSVVMIYRLELAYFGGKISKTRLVYKNAVALVYYVSCVVSLKGHSQLWDRADMNTSFLTLKKVYPNLKSKFT